MQRHTCICLVARRQGSLAKTPGSVLSHMSAAPSMLAVHPVSCQNLPSAVLLQLGPVETMRTASILCQGPISLAAIWIDQVPLHQSYHLPAHANGPSTLRYALHTRHIQDYIKHKMQMAHAETLPARQRQTCFGRISRSFQTACL